MYPVFNPRVHHYALRCRDATTLRVTATARDASHQLTLNNIPVAGLALDENVVVDSDHDIAIELRDGNDSVTYVVHCIPPNFPNIKITKKQAGVSDGLMFFTPARNPFPRDPAFMAIMDNNGVPRFVRHSPGVNPLNFRRHTTDLKIDGRPVHYSVTHRLGSSFDGKHFLLDASFNVIGTVETALPEHSASLHDFLITKDNTFLFFSHGTVTRDVGGNETSTVENVIEEVSPTGDAVWSWKSWDHLTIDPDCLGYTFGLSSDPDITAHINALTLIDGDVVASSRGCAQVVRINRSAKSETDPGTDIVWQLGGTDQDADDRAFLAISGDESGRNEFCRQHHATETAAGRVVLFDNGVNCLSAEIGEPTDPKRGDLPAFSRAVEYDIDLDTGTAEFHREVRLDRSYGYAPFTGSVNILENGHWLINWGYLRYADSSLSVEEYSIDISEVDASGTELLQVKTWEDTSHYSTFRVYRESEADVAIPLNLPVTLTLEDERAAESAGEMVFAVRLSVASSEAVAVDYTTANGTATEGQDYEAQSGTLTFPANSTTPQEIRVPILDDTVDEAEEETLTVRLRNATNATLAGGGTSLAATGTIIDDDTAATAATTATTAGAGGSPGESRAGLLSERHRPGIRLGVCGRRGRAGDRRRAAHCGCLRHRPGGYRPDLWRPQQRLWAVVQLEPAGRRGAYGGRRGRRRGVRAGDVHGDDIRRGGAGGRARRDGGSRLPHARRSGPLGVAAGPAELRAGPAGRRRAAAQSAAAGRWPAGQLREPGAGVLPERHRPGIGLGV